MHIQETQPMLGKLIEAHADVKRDAIHVAVIPVVAGETLNPGSHISIINGCTAVKRGQPLAIVDPFMQDTLESGDRFFAYLYPCTTVGMRHVWQHPDIDPEAQERTIIDTIAEKCGISRQLLIEHAYDHLQEDAEVTIHMGDNEGYIDVTSDEWDEFWPELYRHEGLEPYTARFNGDEPDRLPFRCAC